MKAKIKEARKAGDTLGGIFEITVRGLPAGLGSHIQWDRRLDGKLSPLQVVEEILHYLKARGVVHA